MDNLAIAVVTPVYNAERYLRQCIESILNQTFQNFNLILVDDGSVDKSGKICDEYAEKDPRVKVIHQQNQGAVKARWGGVTSEFAQKAKYIFLCDADDTLRPNALQRLYEEAEENQLDCVCAAMVKTWKNITLPRKYHAPCFTRPRMYTNTEIINELYIGCFGISDFPVNLYTKLYRKELITKAINYPPVVKFMGEDLSVTLRVMPETQRLGIIPDVVYNYRIGGNTSRYMPYMLDDFRSLYRFKTEMRKTYPMPQDAEYYMAVEMLNVLVTWFEMYKQQGKHTKAELTAEIARAAALPEVVSALEVFHDRKKSNRISTLIDTKAYTEFSEMIVERLKKNALKRALKQILYSL